MRTVPPFTWVLLGLLIVTGCARTGSDTLDAVRQRGELRWGADQEGGGPYIFPDPEKPGVITGFEVDLMEELSQQLQVKSAFQQNDWASLPGALSSRTIDVVVNGYELTPDRAARYLTSIPYYIFELQLLVREDSPIRSWDDLQGAQGPVVTLGALQASSAVRYIKALNHPRVQVKEYAGATEAMQDTTQRKLDGVLTDVPIWVHYRKEFPALRPVGDPVDRGYYVMLFRRGDERLRDELNAMLRASLANGTLQKIYEKYQMWNATQRLLSDSETQSAPERAKAQAQAYSGWQLVADNFTLLLKAAGMTVFLSVVSMPLAILIGILVALGRLYGPKLLGFFLGLYVEVIRGTPLLLQLYFIYYVVPELLDRNGLLLPEWLLSNFALPAGIMALAINYSAYEAEIYRAGVLAIPEGQTEAALALGLSGSQTIRYIVLPQAIRLVIPPVTNDFIALFKDTAVCSVIAVSELTKQYGVLRTNFPGAALQLALVTASLYLVMSYPLSLLARRLERKLEEEEDEEL